MALIRFHTTPVSPVHPYKEESINKIYNLLFCDDLSLYKSGNDDNLYPWSVLLTEEPSVEELKKVAADDSLESRQHVLTYNLLQAKGFSEEGKELLGVIVEVGLPEGLDVLAAFGDGSARYINHSGKLVVWESPTTASDQLIDDLFADAARVVDRIGPWKEERRPAPANGILRLSFLVSDGLYFGEGPFEALQQDPLGGPVIDAATSLMIFLTQEVH